MINSFLNSIISADNKKKVGISANNGEILITPIVSLVYNLFYLMGALSKAPSVTKNKNSINIKYAVHPTLQVILSNQCN